MKKIAKDRIKTWFVTGASSGIGYEMCLQLLDKGYNVVAVARHIPNLHHKNALCLSVDVTKPENIKIAIQKGIERFEKIDVLVNNAGVSSNITCEEETLEHMKDVMNVNFFGSFNTINALLPHFRKNKNGTIVNNSSMHGISYRLLGSAYCSSKHALEGLTSVCKLETQKFCRVMAFEFGWFAGTNIVKNNNQQDTIVNEYKNLPSYDIDISTRAQNNLTKGVSCVIEQVEELCLPRHLILGFDAINKSKNEVNILKKSINSSLKYTKKCSIYPNKLKYILSDYIFSITNEYIGENKMKVVNMFGLKFKIKLK